MRSALRTIILSPVFSYAFTDNATSTSDLTTYTFSARNIGLPKGNRKILVGISTRNTGVTVASVTVRGIAATQVTDGTTAAAVTSGTQNRTEKWIADVPDSATGDIVVMFSGGTFRCLIGVWALYGLKSKTPRSVQIPTANSDPASATIQVPPRGCVISYACGNPSGSATVTPGGLTERFDEVAEITHWGADASFPSGGAQAVSADWDGTANGAGNGNGTIFTSWGP